MDVASPPRYRRYSRTGPAPATGSELPAYSRRNTLAAPLQPPREPTAHLFQLAGSSGKAWATLKVFSSAKSAKSLPTFYEKENINGSVELNMERGDTISTVNIRVSFLSLSRVCLPSSLVPGNGTRYHRNPIRRGHDLP